MKSRETKQKDLAALTESLQNSKSAMVVSFTKLTVTKDQEFRNRIREAGAKYQVVKNTLARIAVKDTQYEQATEHFKGVTAIAWTDNDPVILSKAVSKFMKDNAELYTFKTGVVDGKLVDMNQLQIIANLPSKEELISKLLYVLNAQAQRIVTVINAVPRDLAVVIKQIGEKAPEAAPAEAQEKPSEPAAPVEEPPSDEPKKEAPPAEDVPADDKPEPPAEAAEEAQEQKENDQDAGSEEAEQHAEGSEDAEKPEDAEKAE
jgi:large subunit ribosomal protein L10